MLNKSDLNSSQMSPDSSNLTAPQLRDYVNTNLPKRDSLRLGYSFSKIRSDSPGSPLVSVITIVLNGERGIRRCVQSVLSQNYPNIEYVVIDGGSTDGTLEALREFESQIDILVSEPDEGISDAFNKGIAMAHGEILGLLNCDDWYAEGAIRRVVNEFKNGAADIVYGSMQHWSKAGRPSFQVESNHQHLDKGMTIGHPTVFARRAAYDRIGLYRTDFRLAMDYEWLLRAQTSGAIFKAIPEVLANMTDGGLGDRNWVLSLREVTRARSMYLDTSSRRLQQLAYFMKRYSIGKARRGIDALGMHILRRVYHRLFSPLRIR
jgi:glycosyltransferase involved in cell wall biosynthesis